LTPAQIQTDNYLRANGYDDLTHAREEDMDRRYHKRHLPLLDDILIPETTAAIAHPAEWGAIRSRLYLQGYAIPMVAAFEGRIRHTLSYPDLADYIDALCEHRYSHCTLERYVKRVAQAVFRLMEDDPWSWLWMRLLLIEVFGDWELVHEIHAQNKKL
jgi:hypothetical protein